MTKELVIGKHPHRIQVQIDIGHQRIVKLDFLRIELMDIKQSGMVAKVITQGFAIMARPTIRPLAIDYSQTVIR
ncbi:MAG TPA: hypothetical protein VN328_01550 [Thermodesulfovibrionales bacterium]|nr:hypothetical protein [Thermodesulfovibrionales bacterium]